VGFDVDVYDGFELLPPWRRAHRARDHRHVVIVSTRVFTAEGALAIRTDRSRRATEGA
jgi:hypothetical protein